MLAKIDSHGRIALPRAALESLDVAPGDSIELSASEGEIVLRPARDVSPLVQEKGVWVYRSGRAPSRDALEQTINAVRNERIGDLSK